MYDEKISPEEANKQLLVMNEANMYLLFSKKNIANMKKLTEGEGISLANKFKNDFTGFVNSYQLITCNSLCAPFVEPLSNTAGFNKEEYENDHDAMLERVKLVEFT